MSCGMEPAGGLFKTPYFTSSCTKTLKAKDGESERETKKVCALPSGAVARVQPRLTSCVSEELFRMLTFRVLDCPSRVAGNVYRSWGEYTPFRTASSGLAKHRSRSLTQEASNLQSVFFNALACFRVQVQQYNLLNLENMH